MDDLNLLALPFLLPTAELSVHGRWGEGGIALLRDRGRQSTITLPPAIFALLAVLILAAKRPRSDRTWRAGFLSIGELGRELTQRTKGTNNLLLPDAQHIARYAFRARTIFALAMKPAEGSTLEDATDYHEWAKQLLEHRTFFGYRLSTSPEHLRLVLYDDSAEELRPK